MDINLQRERERERDRERQRDKKRRKDKRESESQREREREMDVNLLLDEVDHWSSSHNNFTQTVKAVLFITVKNFISAYINNFDSP